MIINAEALARLYTALSAVFNAAFQGAEPTYPQYAMTVPSNTRIMDYKFLLDFPMMREWIGDRVLRDLKPEAFLVENKDWEATIEVDRNDLEDDTLGLYNPIVAALGEEARKHPDKLIADLLVDAWTVPCYDGQPLIDDAHPVGEGTADNDGGGAGKPWFLIDNTRAIKPFIYQVRRAIQLTRMDLPNDENVFMRKKYRYGVDGRWAVAPGLWQLIYGSKDTLTEDHYAAARTAMMTLTNAEGRILGIRPSLLVVPPSLEGTARQLLNAQFVIGGDAVGGSKTNIWQGTASLLVIPELDLA
jgi:phage major head subunit gpT-like protein